jgi:hypothetical protein
LLKSCNKVGKKLSKKLVTFLKRVGVGGGEEEGKEERDL